MRAIMLHPNDVLTYWPTLRPYIDKALEHGHENTSHDLCRYILNNAAQCWVCLGDDNDILNVTVCEIDQYPQYKAYRIITSTGDGWQGYKELHHEIEKYARENGCQTVQFWGRRGWERHVKKLEGLHGERYETDYIVMSMRLKDVDPE